MAVARVLEGEARRLKEALRRLARASSGVVTALSPLDGAAFAFRKGKRRLSPKERRLTCRSFRQEIPMPEFSRFSTPQIAAAGNLVREAVRTSPGEYPLDEATLAEYAARGSALESAIEAANIAIHAARAATKAKVEARQAMVDLLALTAKRLDGDASVTDALLLRAGFTPRRTGRGVRVTSLSAPTELRAEAYSTGVVRLCWSRANHRKGTAFAIYAAQPGEDYRIVEVTTRSSIELSGYRPGVCCLFKIVAKRSGLTSPASGAALIYGTTEPVSRGLRVA